MWKSPTDTYVKYSSIRRNQRIRRILLLLYMIVMLVMTGLLINGRGMGQSLQNTASPEFEQQEVIFKPTTNHSDHKYPKKEVTPTQIITSTATPSPDTIDIIPTQKENITPTTEIIKATQPQTSRVQVDASDKTGTLFLSIDEDGFKHLFAYHPQKLPFTRLTLGKWDDIQPSINSTGTLLAFSSNRNGYWDIYVLNLNTGVTSQITDTPEYDGAPSWSPDSNWLVYESYSTLEYVDTATLNDPTLVQNLDIFITQVNLDNPNTNNPVRLTNHPGVDSSPTWSPSGRKIVFVSTRSGESDIWLADLDKIDDRFINISQNPGGTESFPSWSPDGNALAWASTAHGYQNIYINHLGNDHSQSQVIGTGNHPVWSPDGGTLVTSLLTPNRTYLSGYSTNPNGLVLPPIPLIGTVTGLTWSRDNLPDPLPLSIAQIAEADPSPSWQVTLENNQGSPGDRHLVVPILDVEAPYPMLQDMVDESFTALREAVTAKIGWDYLSSLENAYVPLTTPLSPGMLEDWLYTGRAFTINPAVINAGWMVVFREDFGAETYWRVYLRARFQDGSQGVPLRNFPWDFTARYSGDPRTYEHGGAFVPSIPPGYWVDFTEIAASKGWLRVPALSTWRSAIPSARYNEFVMTDGLDWYSAMLEIYPPEALSDYVAGNQFNNNASLR